MHITKETLNKYVGDKSVIELDDLLDLMNKEFGIVVPMSQINGLDNLTEEQIKRTTKAISENEEIKDQIRSSRASRDANFSAYAKDDTEFKKS